MKQYAKLLLVIFVGAVVLSSCSKTNKQGKLIPNNAMAIIHIDGKSLSSKVSWDEIKQTAWFNKMHSDTSRPAWADKILANPETSGIDIKSDFIVFFTKTPGNETIVVLEGDVKDAKAFEQFNKDVHKDVTASKDGDLNFLSSDKGVVGWNDSRFVYVFNSPTSNIKYGANMFDTTAKMAPVGGEGAQLIASCKSIFNIKSDSSMAGNEKFTALLKEEGDIHYWQNTEELIKGNAQMGMLGMLKLDAFLKDNISTATLSFDNGKITIKHKAYVSKELTDVLKKYGGGSIDQDMVKNIPSQNVDGIFALHFKPEGLKELIKLTGMDGMLNSQVAAMGFNLDDFVAANKGDIMFALTDLAVNNNMGMSSDKPAMNFIFAVGIGDKNAFGKLMNAGRKLSANMNMDSTVHFAQNDKYFAIGNKQDFVSKYIAGGNNKFSFLDKLSGGSYGFYVDINKLLQAFTGAPMDSSAKVVLNQSMGMWADVYSTSEGYKDDGFKSTTEINLVDKSTNSLKQLNKYFDNVSKILIEEDKKKAAMMPQVDTTMMMAPPVTDTTVTSPSN